MTKGSSNTARLYVRVDTAPFDLNAECRAARAACPNSNDIGAMVTFTGTVRDLNTGLQSLSLEHYPGMTEREIETVANEAANRWPLLGMRIIHRVGPMAVGEDIVLVISLSKHRRAAFESAEYMMDHLKTRAPFWKKETLTDGTSSWVDARESDNTARDRWDER